MAHELAAVAARAQRRAPDFFIVGQPKSGTTALYEMLRSHPQLYMPDAQGAAVPGERPARRAALADRASATAHARGLPGAVRGGRARPAHRGGVGALPLLPQRRGQHRRAAARGADHRDLARAGRASLRSLHLQLLQDHSETESDLRAALSLEGERREGKHIPRECARPAALYYSEHVRYVEQLRRYHEVFASEQMLVLIYDDFRADNAATVRTVLRFLGRGRRVADRAGGRQPHGAAALAPAG